MFQAFRDRVSQQQRRQELTNRLRKFTEASATLPTTSLQPTPPASSARPTTEAPSVAKAVYAFTYDPYTTERGAL